MFPNKKIEVERIPNPNPESIEISVSLTIFLGRSIGTCACLPKCVFRTADRAAKERKTMSKVHTNHEAQLKMSISIIRRILLIREATQGRM
jgi:hypothetical protein